PLRHAQPDRDRYRQLGGTTALWGGRCMPFDLTDFERRDHVPHSGWPIARADLDPYYLKAHEYCECGRFAYHASALAEGAPRELISGFADGDVLTSTLERWSPPTRFGQRYRADLARAANIRVLLRAAVTGIETDADGRRVSHLDVAALGGGRFTGTAKSVVLAGGGLEVARLLMASNEVNAAGLGDHSGWLGRGYMCHLHGVVARVKLAPSSQVQFGYERDVDGVYCRRRLSLSPEAQRRLELLNLYALLDRPLVGDPDHGNALLSMAFLAKRLVQHQSRQNIGKGKTGLYWYHIKNILLGSPEVVSFLPRFGRERFLQSRRVPSLLVKPRSNNFHLYFHSEQAPSRDSRVTLTNERDALGMPRLNVKFRLSELDVDSVYRAHQVIDAELRRQGSGVLEFERDDAKSHIRECGAVLGHHLGTARMAASPEHGVVDPDCRVHGLANLYIASGAVFPTSSQAHPTLTIVALAVRLAEHLVSIRCAA
ncbi:MAG: GMC family oxidoreductase, partial [Gammaproteobacteria bacterium]|nr:GMC family oxidoreductase [Gammaproteobacteria bacterium]